MGTVTLVMTVFGLKHPSLVTVVLVATGILLVLLLYIGVASGIWRHVP